MRQLFIYLAVLSGAYGSLYGEYILAFPKGQSGWYLAHNADRAVWIYHASPTEFAERGRFDLIEYPPETYVVVEERTEGAGYFPRSDEKYQVEKAVLVKVTRGELKNTKGWVVEQLLQLTPEEKKYLAAQKAAAQKAAAAKKAAAQKAADDERRKIAAMPKLYSGSETVIVATSIDCAKDLQKVVEFGRKNGTGVEFRRKFLELSTLGCSKTFASGTPIVVTGTTGGFVSFLTYPASDTGVALPENVR